METHPECSCGCGSRVLNESKLHPRVFGCRDCNQTLSNSEEWLKHASHILICPSTGSIPSFTSRPTFYGAFDVVYSDTSTASTDYADCARCSHPKCSSVSKYFAKSSNMRDHLDRFAFKCKECPGVYFLRESHLKSHNKNLHPKSVSPPPAPAKPVSESSTRVGTTSSAPEIPIIWNEKEQKLTTMVHQNCAEQNFPAWTLCHEEQQTLTKARNELKAKPSAAKTFQLREQGSIPKNTAIPAFADFDFILQVRNISSNCYGKG